MAARPGADLVGAGYENAPATLLLATNCAVCGRALVDAKSVEIGMGPDCRRKHGYEVEVGEEARKEANLLIHTVAFVLSHTPKDLAGTVLVVVPRLQVLGFTQLAEVLGDRASVVKVEEQADGRISLATPYSQEVVDAQRAIPGRRWDKVGKVNTFPGSSRGEVWALLRRLFAGQLGKGPKGLFIVGGGA